MTGQACSWWTKDVQVYSAARNQRVQVCRVTQYFIHQPHDPSLMRTVSSLLYGWNYKFERGA